MEYYFQDQLRWTFGFDNPNKAAALLATLLPFVWLIYALAWRITGKSSRRMALVVSTSAIVIGWGLLIMTFSRGGLVAGGVANCYLGWKAWLQGTRNKLRMLISGGLFAVILLGGLATGAAHRSTQWIGKREGSVDNRLTLWKGALEMIYAIPQGVGTGRSGNVYMQWFQPLENTARYRTLVNSFLTFTVEQGLGIALGSLFIVLVFWKATNSRDTPAYSSSQNAVVCMRASLLAFAVAGFFSTTMEEWRLWIIPVMVIVGLVVMIDVSRLALDWMRVAGQAFIGVLLIVGPVWSSAWWFQRQSSLDISYEKSPWEIIRVQPGQGIAGTLQIALDDSVLGDNAGKLLRRLSVEKKMKLVVGFSNVWDAQSQAMLLAGNQVLTLSDAGKIPCILLAPAIVEEATASKILREARSLHVILPDFDEDGRVAFWKEKIADQTRKEVTVTTLSGVGTQIEWAWDAVMSEVEEH